MDNTMLNKIIEKHKKWATNKEGGERANLSGADLRDANLSEADLRGADFSGADLRDANLSEADFSGADFSGADLSGANLCRVELWWANLCGANLCGANLRGADLSRADLSRADLRGADLREANNIPYIPMACPDTGSFVAWKSAGNYIIKLLIPDDAIRSSATGRKCRANKARVLEIQNVDGEKVDINSVESDYDSNVVYRIGQEVIVPDFEENRFIECASGIHFFINRQEAINYGIYNKI